MHDLGQPYPTLSKIQALHHLALLAVSPATAKLLNNSACSALPPNVNPLVILSSATSSVPPSGPGITTKPNIWIKF